jgi:hypothetical protein
MTPISTSRKRQVWIIKHDCLQTDAFTVEMFTRNKSPERLFRAQSINSARFLFAFFDPTPREIRDEEDRLVCSSSVYFGGGKARKQHSHELNSPSQNILEIVDFAVGERDDRSWQPRTWTVVSRGQVVSLVHGSCSASNPTPETNINDH